MAAKVLLVEDDNNLREIYEARLQAEGYTIASARDGEEALVVAKNERPDLVISDVMMPKISGFEMLDILRNTDGLKHVKVIMLTALGQAEDKTRADQLGADKYLVKSQVTLEDIVATAHQLLDAPAGTPGNTAPTNVSVAAPTTPAVTAAPTPNIPVAAAPAPTTPVAPVAPTPPTTAVPVTTPTPEPTPPATTIPVVTPPVESAPPTATPSTLSTSTPPVTPPVTPTPAAATANPQTAAQEEETMKSQIEDFVNSNQTAAPAADDTVPTADQSNTAVMAEAVNDLVASTQPPTQSSSTITAVEVPPTPEPTNAPTSATPNTPATASAEASPDSVTIAHKKIIQPLQTPTKPDINSLLAAEEAKTTMPSADTIAPSASITPTPEPAIITATQPSLSAPGTGFDPNNIAL